MTRSDVMTRADLMTRTDLMTRGAPMNSMTYSQPSTHRLDAAPRRRGRLRVTARGRRLLLLLFVLVLAGAVVLWHAGASQAVQQTEPGPVLSQLTVQSGDTLWSVARRIAPQRDARDVVDQLRRLNSLRTGQLRVGQQLLLPAVV